MSRSTSAPIRTLTHRFIRSTQTNVVVGNSVTQLNGYYNRVNATLNSLIGFNDFTNLFDQYRIDLVRVTFSIRQVLDAQVAAVAQMPKLWWHRDMDDDIVPLSINSIKERGNARWRVLDYNKPVTVFFKPNTLQQIYRTPTTVGFSPKFSQWIDCASADLNHFGIKYAIDNLPNTITLEVDVQMHLSCKNTL